MIFFKIDATFGHPALDAGYPDITRLPARNWFSEIPHQVRDDPQSSLTLLPSGETKG